MKILFALFGAMGDVFNGLPVVKALREKYPEAEITWLTLPQYQEIAECEWVDRMLTHGTGRHGDGIPQELLDTEHFDVVFFPQGSVNHDEWEQSGLHMIDFMARKCGVTVSSRAPEIPINQATKEKAEEFWRKHKLEGKTVIAIACSALSCRPWPLENFRELVIEILKMKNTVIVHFGGKNDPPLPRVIDCRNMPIKIGIDIMRCCDLFIGCDSGPSWMASCTDIPIIVFMDQERQQYFNVGFKSVMPEKDISELSIESSVKDVTRSIRARLKKPLISRLLGAVGKQ